MSMSQFLPAILARDEADFHARIFHKGLRALASTWHIDVLDGSMFHATCWADPSIIGTWHNLPEIELHIMSHNPLPHLEAWARHVPTVTRAILHAEIARPLGAIVERMPHLRWTLALNPETDVDAPHAHYHLFDRVQIMGVHPGASGQLFLGEPIFAKIRRFCARYPHRITIDGGVTSENASPLLAAGADRLIVGSALWKHEDPVEALHALIAATE